MTRTGNCYDNAAMEPFFWSLKHEWTNHDNFADLQKVRLSVFKSGVNKPRSESTSHGPSHYFPAPTVSSAICLTHDTCVIK